MSWHFETSKGTGEQAPTFIVAPLAGGVRRLPPDLVHLADEVYPAARVLLLCRDQLVRPHVDLGDGRLMLIDPGASADDLAERFRAAGRWRAQAVADGSGPLREVRAGGARTVVMRVDEPSGSLVCVPAAGAAWWRSAPDHRRSDAGPARPGSAYDGHYRADEGVDAAQVIGLGVRRTT